jgi:hypothetical protein
VEKPETWGNDGIDAPGSGGGTVSDEPDKAPDITASYTVKGDWGEVTAAALVRQLKQDTGDVNETAVAANVSGKIKIGKHDDLRFQLNVGESGRYIGAGMTRDIVVDPMTMRYEVEETTAYTVSYRHAWN